MTEPRATSIPELFRAFLKLGVTSFGGPIAHVGYFRREFVERRGWVTEDQFAQLIAISQFLPGPGSSQMAFSMGLLRGGWAGAVVAILAFTLPSALLLFAFAALLPRFSSAAGDAAIHGLKIVALAVVAHGVLGMARQLCPDVRRATIAALATAILIFFGHAWAQLVVIALGAIAGLVLCRGAADVPGETLHVRYGPKQGGALLGIFVLLLVGLPLAAIGTDGIVAVASAFYHAGALVFGGGHVVLPLLQETVVAPGWISRGDFLAGYGAAQAVPGPMFSLAAYLGARLTGGDGGPVGAAVALTAIFLPGLLLVAGILPFWRAIAARPAATRTIAGVNAAVVGLLAAALYDPVWVSAVRVPLDAAIALVGFALLRTGRVSPLLVVAWCVAARVGQLLLGL